MDRAEDVSNAYAYGLTGDLVCWFDSQPFEGFSTASRGAFHRTFVIPVFAIYLACFVAIILEQCTYAAQPVAILKFSDCAKYSRVIEPALRRGRDMGEYSSHAHPV